MAKQLHITEGLAGTGKTYDLYNNAIEKANNGYKVLYICYNKRLENQAKSVLSEYKNIAIMTLHAYTYKILKKNNLLPKKFSNTNTEDRPTDKDYNKLLTQFIKADSLIYDTHYDYIFVDEYQDFNDIMLNILKNIESDHNCIIHFYGDPHQNLYVNNNCNDKYISPRERIEKIFSGFKIIYNRLSISYRSNNHILSLANSFIRQFFKSDHIYMIKKSNEKQNDSVPTINFFNHQKDEIEFVINSIPKDNRRRKIIIQSTYKRDLEIYKNNEILKEYVDSGQLYITTINANKGLEADIVFWVAFQNVNTESKVLNNQIELYYTGLTRAKKRLIISSSYPKNDLHPFWTELLKKGSSSQRKSKSHLNTKVLRRLEKLNNKNIYFTKKLFYSSIDSLTFKIDVKDVPFIPYIQRVYRNGEYNFVNRIKKSFKGVNYSIRYHTSSDQYFFDFLDLTPLKKIGLTDKDIVEFCFALINNFFDGRIKEDSINLHKIDIAAFIFKENLYNIDFFSKEISDLLLNSKANSIIGYRSDKDMFNYSKSNRTWHINGKHTLYHNRYANRDRVLTIYKPINKKNHNKIPKRNLIKFESRMKFPGKEVKYTLKDLLEKIEDKSYLTDMTYLLPDILEIIEKHITNTQTANLNLFETLYKNTTISNDISIREPYLKKVDL